MNSALKNKYRKQLLDLESELMELLGLSSEASKAVELDQARMGRVTRGDAMQQQAMISAAHLRDEKRLLAVRRALKRIERDEFGHCSECGEDIKEARLEIAPEIELCLDCQAIFERQQ
ncbi:hypothetical protein GCM10009123_06160 [Kangiella japonica]|uniref:Zinc finger DksA/TraR C4-type domain-containing protein n=1 Tax=Kangiella japonica TaxID=647384 RepID=A0ABN0SV20_9GAMM